MKKCRLCGDDINLKVDMTLCGYEKCVKCCGSCMHRTHYNPDSPKGRARLDQINKLHRTVLGDFFGRQ